MQKAQDEALGLSDYCASMSSLANLQGNLKKHYTNGKRISQGI